MFLNVLVQEFLQKHYLTGESLQIVIIKVLRKKYCEVYIKTVQLPTGVFRIGDLALFS